MDHGDREDHARNMARAAQLDARKECIRTLNDSFRRTMVGGRWMITPGVKALGPLAVGAIIEQVRAFDGFTPENDPYDEHDFGSVKWAGQKILWKVDAYDKKLEFGSPDPTDPNVTARVITIMLASEY